MIEAINTIDPGRLAAVPKQDEQPSAAEPLPLVGEVAQLRSQFRFGGRQERWRTIVRSAFTIEQARRSDRPMTACRCATPLRLAAGPTIFSRSSRSAAASNIFSGRSFLSLTFSPSIYIGRFASETSMPPYLAFQL